MLLDLLLDLLHSATGQFQALDPADNSHIVPHDPSNQVPVVINKDLFVHRLGFTCLPGLDLGQIFATQNGPDLVTVVRGPLGVDDSFQQGVAGQPIAAMQSCTGGLAQGQEIFEQRKMKYDPKLKRFVVVDASDTTADDLPEVTPEDLQSFGLRVQR